MGKIAENVKVKKIKTDNILLRIHEKDNKTIEYKSKLFGIKKSKLLREGAFKYWPTDIEDITVFKQFLKEYTEGDDETKNNIVEILFEYYRRIGFPYKKISNKKKINTLESLIKTEQKIDESKGLGANHTGVDLANYFHRHMITVPYGNSKSKTPIETYEDDSSLKDCIKRWLDLGKIPNHAGIRNILKSRNGTRSVVNFRPSIAKYLYQRYVPDNGNILDPCSGFSGRLLGCISSGKNLNYTGIDPDSRTALGNMKCAGFFAKQFENNERKYKFGFNFHLGCAEDVMKTLEDKKYDFIFTSPPYFSVEKYSDLPDQSCNKFSNYDVWFRDFLCVIASESFRVLKDDGRFSINIKNYEKHTIADDLIKYCESIGFTLEETLNIKMINLEYFRKKEVVEKKGAYHNEPIMIFKKKIT